MSKKSSPTPKPAKSESPNAENPNNSFPPTDPTPLSAASTANPQPLGDLIGKLATIQQDLTTVFKDRYYNNQPVFTVKMGEPPKDLIFNLKDLLLIGAISCAHVLLSGSSGAGKTFLAELLDEFIYGKENYMRKNITPEMNEQDFLDIDFGAIKEGKTFKEALRGDAFFNRPALIIDEANRAPPIVQNRLMQILENNIDIKSKKIKAGVSLANGLQYHFCILTLNFGDEYAGTAAVDRALHDRITIDIPIDNFPPTLDDQIKMVRKSSRAPAIPADSTRSETLYQLYLQIDNIPVSIEAEVFMLYLSFMSNCVKSSTQSKYGVNFSPQFCKEKDCPFARNPPLSDICPYTFAPSNRVLRKLVQVTRAFILLKHAKFYAECLKNWDSIALAKYATIPDLEVGLDDVLLIAPFVLNAKVPMNREWVINKFDGNAFLAIKNYIKIGYSQISRFMMNLLKILVEEKRDPKSMTESRKGQLSRALKEDFHLEGIVQYTRDYLE